MKKGEKMSVTVKAKLIASLTGRKLSVEHCRNLSKAATGKTQSQEARIKIGAARKGKSPACKLPTGRAARNSVFRRYKKECADQRGLCWELTDQDFDRITASPCYYCGIPPSTTHGGGGFNGTFIYNGIDRKDNSLGYTRDNTVAACFDCNSSKSKKTYADFIAWLDRIVKYRGPQCLHP